jgi:tRNA modification GTPase
VDTAGLRDACDPVEQLGVGVARDYIERAAVVLVCAETVDGLRATAAAVAAVSSAPIILVATKADLQRVESTDLVPARHAVSAVGAVSASAESGSGLKAVLEMIVALLDTAADPSGTDAPILTRARHQHVIVHAHDDLLTFRRALDEHTVPVSIATVHLRAAVTALEDLIGLVDVEHILDEVFSRFCVGK